MPPTANGVHVQAPSSAPSRGSFGRGSRPSKAALRYTGGVNPSEEQRIADRVRERAGDLQALILEVEPHAQFKLDTTTNWDIWHLAVYTSDGTIRMPPPAIKGMVDLWHELRVTIITTIYPLTAYQEP